jgi:hypothetical protein
MISMQQLTQVAPRRVSWLGAQNGSHLGRCPEVEHVQEFVEHGSLRCSHLTLSNATTSNGCHGDDMRGSLIRVVSCSLSALLHHTRKVKHAQLSCAGGRDMPVRTHVHDVRCIAGTEPLDQQ